MSETQTAIVTPSPVPPLPCPNCNENILEKGWHNSCSEIVSLREDNHTFVSGGHVYMDHGEDDHETMEHTCEEEAYCSKLQHETSLDDLRDPGPRRLKNGRHPANGRRPCGAGRRKELKKQWNTPNSSHTLTPTS